MDVVKGGFLQKILFFAFDKYGRMFLIVDWYVNFDPGTKRIHRNINKERKVPCLE